MKTQRLVGKRVAILAADGFEQVELQKPLESLERAGAEVFIVSPELGEIQGMNHMEMGDKFAVDLDLKHASEDDFDALVIPGGLYNPDTLRSTPAAVDFARSFVEAGKPIAAICHGPWVLVEADVVHGREMTSWPAIKTDVMNAGGDWVDRKVVVDHGLVTSRQPSDIPAFCRKMVEEIEEGRHAVMTEM